MFVRLALAFVAAATVLAAASAADPALPSWEIYSANADGSNRISLSQDPANDLYPVLSPRGGKIAFVSNRAGYDAVYTMNDDGTDQRRLTDRITQGDRDLCELLTPAWSPSGATIAFTAHCLYSQHGDPRLARNWIYTVNPSGRSQRELIADAFGASFSADGRYLAYTHQVSPYAPASLALATSSGEHEVVFPSARTSAWSPTGHRLAYGLRNSAVVVDAARPRQKWTRRLPGLGTPSWSTRGNVLSVFVGGARPGMYVMHPPSRRVTRLADLGEDATAVWAPNGRWAALQGGQNVYVVTSGGRFLQIVGGPSPVVTWSPDSARLAWADVTYGGVVISTPRGDETAVGSHAELVSGLTWSADSRRVIFASDCSACSP